MSDDLVLEAEDGDGSTGTPEQKLKQLREKLKHAESEAADNLAGWQRSKADYINLTKRVREMEESLAEAGLRSSVLGLTDVFDSIEASGHSALMKQLDSTLSRLGVARFRPEVGSPFNPVEQEAVSGVASEDKTQDNTVHAVLQSGYAQDGSIIRPARVSVYHTH